MSSVESFDPRQSVTVTDEAKIHFRKQLDQAAGNTGVRLSVKESGCTGYMYVVDLVETSEDNDLDISLDNGVHLYVDRDALPVVQGTVIDMTTEGLNRVLTFKNPNVVEQCGCGESFNIAQ